MQCDTVSAQRDFPPLAAATSFLLRCWNATAKPARRIPRFWHRACCVYCRFSPPTGKKLASAPAKERKDGDSRLLADRPSRGQPVGEIMLRRLAYLSCSCLAAVALAASAEAQEGAPSSLKKSTVLKPSLSASTEGAAEGVDEHPLVPAVKLARDILPHVERIEDYSCTFILRERVDGELQEHSYLEMKVRHQPFSIYAKTLYPKAGEEVIYVEGRNDGRMWAHTTGSRDRAVGAVLLDPLGSRAMQDRRYPITQAGLLNLGRRIVEVGQHDLEFGECEVNWFEEAKINDRPSTCIEVVHPTRRREFLYHKVRIYVDHEFRVPVRFESYGWPREEGEEPPLNEEYSYLDLKFNNGFTDKDFSPRNPAYKFRILD
jgi:hypothetical protein